MYFFSAHLSTCSDPASVLHSAVRNMVNTQPLPSRSSVLVEQEGTSKKDNSIFVLLQVLRAVTGTKHSWNMWIVPYSVGSMTVISAIYRYPHSPEQVGLHFSPPFKLEDMWLVLPWWSWKLGLQLGSWVLKMTVPLLSTLDMWHEQNTSLCCVKPLGFGGCLLLQLAQSCWLIQRLMTCGLAVGEFD